MITGVLQEVVGKKRYLVKFQDELEKVVQPKQINIMVVRSEVEEEIEVREVEMIPEVRKDLGCDHWVYIYLNFIKEDGADKR